MLESSADIFPEDLETENPGLGVTLILYFVLLALGAAVLMTVFYWLDPQDSRPLYNPWTYVVLVPVALIFISTLLRTLVSRFVARTLQATFLVSVLVHLALLNYAGNTIILSRSFPDFFESIDHERRQLKLQSLHARQYVPVSNAVPSEHRPDHLKPVPTEHQPTEEAKTISVELQLARNDQSHLASPEVELQPTPTTHLLKRSQPQSTNSLPDAQPTELSRSELSRPFLGKLLPIDTPIAADVSPSNPELSTSQISADSANRRSSGSATQISQSPSELAGPSSDVRSLGTASASPLRRSTAEAKLTEPTEGAAPLAIARSAAGGTPGAAARSSIPIYGSDSFAAPSPKATESLAASTASRQDRSSSPLSLQAQAGAARSRRWEGAPSLAGGFRGRSPSQLAAQPSNGDAAADDVAGLTGSGSAVERTSLGLATRQSQSSADSLEDSSSAVRRGDATARSAPASNSPTAAAVQVPAQASVGSSSDPAQVRLENAEGISRSQSVRGAQSVSNPLDISAPDSIGGLATKVPTESLSSLSRRRTDSAHIAPPQIQPQRIARSEVGGPRGPGSSSAVAKPAFQQRLDRLQNQDSPETSTLQPQTEQAIERGLAFLAKHQRPDGSWRLQDFDTEVLIRSDTAATGLALLAFQGAGYTHLQSRYAAQLDKAIAFLAQHQQANGDLYIPQDPASDQNAWLYSHSIAALALSEAFGMTQDERLRPIAQKAIDFMIASQDARRGGWRYRPELGSDTSVTGWFMMALHSGRLAGLRVPQTTFAAIDRFANNAQAGSATPHLYRYNPYAPDSVEQRHGLRPTAVMTSVGLLIRLYSGWHRDREEMVHGANFLLEHWPQHGTADSSRRDTYYWYYATQVIFHMGGTHWQRWHDTLYPLLIQSQVSEGLYAGSWSPFEPVPDLWARYGGRLYVTTMNLLSLEVSYRHLPLYEATAP